MAQVNTAVEQLLFSFQLLLLPLLTAEGVLTATDDHPCVCVLCARHTQVRESSIWQEHSVTLHSQLHHQMPTLNSSLRASKGWLYQSCRVAFNSAIVKFCQFSVPNRVYISTACKMDDSPFASAHLTSRKYANLIWRIVKLTFSPKQAALGQFAVSKYLQIDFFLSFVCTHFVPRNGNRQKTNDLDLLSICFNRFAMNSLSSCWLLVCLDYGRKGNCVSLAQCPDVHWRAASMFLRCVCIYVCVCVCPVSSRLVINCQRLVKPSIPSLAPSVAHLCNLPSPPCSTAALPPVCLLHRRALFKFVGE